MSPPEPAGAVSPAEPAGAVSPALPAAAVSSPEPAGAVGPALPAVAVSSPEPAAGLGSSEPATGLGNPRLLHGLTWGGPVLTVVFAVGLIPLAGFFPPPSPTLGAQSIARLYSEHATAIRLGCFAMIVGLVFLVPWGVALAAWCRRIPGADPALATGQLVCLAVSTALIEVIPTVWAVAAYRAGSAAADVTQAFNDLGWFLLLFAWPPFSLWGVLVAASVLSDRRERPLLPRWTAYLSLWDALLLVPGGLMAFFKVGPFAWDGIMAFYIPLTVFFVWLVGMTVVMFRLGSERHVTGEPVPA